VKINNDTVWETSYYSPTPRTSPGVNILLVEPFNCSLQESRYFNTNQLPVAAIDLSNYLLQVSQGAIIVGVTADEPTYYLARALPTLQQLLVDVSDVGYRGSFVFVAQKGFPAKTQLRKTLNEQESARYQPRLIFDITGIIENSLTV